MGRLSVCAFVLGVVAIIAVTSVGAIRDAPADERTAAALFAGSAWLVSFAVGVALNLVHARRGTLILRDPAAREANRQRIRAMNPKALIVPAVAVSIGIGYLSPNAEAVYGGLLGGFLLALAPVVVWIAITNPGNGR